ncbi:MAG: hypothetical protein KC609_24590 [Myxococcales bacterium]|nr:hypothetical protein [Myxococcales bacterium]
MASRILLVTLLLCALLGPPLTGCTSGSSGSQDSGDSVTAADGIDDGSVLVDGVDAGEPSDQPISDAVETPDTTSPDTFVAGEFGSPCKYNTDCKSEFCVPAPKDSPYPSVCTKKCIQDCPTGWYCKAGPGVGRELAYICVPEVNTLCAECLKDTDCNTAGDLCVATEKDGGKKFCARDCSADPENPNVCPEGFGCTALRDEANKIYAYQCLPTTGSCECGDSIDLTSDPDNCGICHKKCQFDNSTPNCVDKVCGIEKCDDGWVDLNKTLDDGCEYECTKTSETDEPDPLGKDANCDGIDGEWTKAVFVDGQDGHDDTGDGTPEFPFKTITKGISVADQANPKLAVYVMEGIYSELVTMKSGVSVYGGYSRANKWAKRNRDLYVTKIFSNNAVETHAVIAVVANGITQPTTLAGFHIESADNPNPGGSSYAIWVKGSTKDFVIEDNVIKAGKGNNGEKGDDGQTINHSALVENGVTYTTTGKQGESSTHNTTSSNTGGLGGQEGARVCTWNDVANDGTIKTYRAIVRGGKGGNGGDKSRNCCDDQGGNGFPGGKSTMSLDEKNSSGVFVSIDSDISGFSKGGTGGTAGDCGFWGTSAGKDAPDDAQTGRPGTVGTNGVGGNGSGLVSSPGYWLGSKGGNGTAGLPGHGGGGGGGGSGAGDGSGGWCDDKPGGGGSGGGSGGCGGTGGKGGSSGGGSFGVFLVDSASVIRNNSITTSAGGNGGNGGNGGTPEDGDKGGSCDGSACDGDSHGTNGAPGKDGGKGGHGGHGAGGGGGVSFGIYHASLGGKSDPTCSGNTFTIGKGGKGGEGGTGFSTTGGKGTDGKSGTVNLATTLCKTN